MNFFMTMAATLMMSVAVQAAKVNVNDSAPLFKATTHDGKTFDLASRKGKWTVLYFYPKANTPGCTKQACAFRDNIEKIRSQGAEVYGISADTVADQAAFHEEHHLTFPLIADPDDKVIDLYGTKMDDKKLSKRWTYIIDPDLKVRSIAKDVDPVTDAERVAKEIATLKK